MKTNSMESGDKYLRPEITLCEITVEKGMAFSDKVTGDISDVDFGSWTEE